jgi:signal peptidase
MTDKKQKVLNIVGLAICVILIPILIMNCVLIVKGLVNEKEVPGVFGRTPLIVLTDSMYPEIKSGDIIICKDISPEDVKVGDVISFFDPEDKNGVAVVTHRVIEIITDDDGKLYFRTKGDNNNANDKASVPAENLVGLWTETRFAGLGHVALFMQSTWGLVVCIFLPLALFVGYEIFRRRKQDTKQQSDMDALMAELAALKAAQQQPENKDNNDTQ